jgi:hypothetical protein
MKLSLSLQSLIVYAERPVIPTNKEEGGNEDEPVIEQVLNQTTFSQISTLGNSSSLLSQ